MGEIQNGDGAITSIDQWPVKGKAHFIEITPTDDPVTDEDVDEKVLEGPGYFADNNANMLPDIGNVHYYNPLTTETNYGYDDEGNEFKMKQVTNMLSEQFKNSSLM